MKHDHRSNLVPRAIRCVQQATEHGQFVRRGGRRVAEEAQHRGRRVEWMCDEAAHDLRDGMKREGECGSHANVSAAAAHCPEEIRIFFGAARENTAVGGHYLCGDQIVHGHAVQRHQPSDSAAERQSSHAGRGDDAARRGETVLLRRHIECAPCSPAFRRRRTLRGIDCHIRHEREVDHQAIVAARAAGHIMSTASHGDVQSFGSGELYRCDDVVHAAASRDRRRLFVDQAIVNLARLIVAVVAGKQHRATKGRPKVADFGFYPGVDGHGGLEGRKSIEHYDIIAAAQGRTNLRSLRDESGGARPSTSTYTSSRGNCERSTAPHREARAYARRDRHVATDPEMTAAAKQADFP